jgi:hypothetical protein
MANASLYENWSEYISWRDPRMRSWDQYLLVDPSAESKSNFVTGLEFASGSPKPTYDAWRMPLYLPQTSGPRGVPLEVWGCARPVLYAPGARKLTIQFRSGPGGPFKTVKTVTVSPDNCYFDVPIKFASSGAVQTSWSAPGQPVLHSRPVPITVS